MSVWVTERNEPTIIVGAAMTHTMTSQSQRAPGDAADIGQPQERPKAAAFVHAAMKPVTGVGAPW